jgi:hypothetical protein
MEYKFFKEEYSVDVSIDTYTTSVIFSIISSNSWKPGRHFLLILPSCRIWLISYLEVGSLGCNLFFFSFQLLAWNLDDRLSFSMWAMGHRKGTQFIVLFFYSNWTSTCIYTLLGRFRWLFLIFRCWLRRFRMNEMELWLCLLCLFSICWLYTFTLETKLRQPLGIVQVVWGLHHRGSQFII